MTIKIPKSMPLLTETHDMRFEQRSSGDRLIYEWHYTNNNPLRESYIALDPRDRWPRLFASSFRNHEQFAAAYWAAIESKIAVTPAIQKLADEITQGISDRRRQAEAIYNWVSRRIRYVAVEIGRGAYIPHDADVALSNGYGDCKDKAVLFSALLKAKGIASNVVLINQGVSFTLPTPPIFGTLNHAITWIPEFNLYADSTGGVAPFGMLSLLEYGKPVVHATATAPAIHRTPTLPANSASITLKTKARLSPDGKIAGESEASAVGPLSISLREDAVSIQSAGLEQAAKQQLRSRGYEGIGKFEFTSPFDPASTYRIAGHFETNPRPEILAGNSFYVPLGLAIGPVPGDLLMGRLNFIDPRGDEPTPCFSGHEIEELSLEIPEGRRLRDLPKGKEIKNKYLHFKSEWSFAGRTVTVRREFTSTIDQPLCIGESRRLAAKALNEIRGDYTTAVTLADK